MAMEQIEVKILDRTFKLQVPPNEKPRLMNAVRIVDQKMREIRDASLAHGVERIAVNAALQITYEFLGQPVDSGAATVEQVQTLVTQLNNEPTLTGHSSAATKGTTGRTCPLRQTSAYNCFNPAVFVQAIYSLNQCDA